MHQTSSRIRHRLVPLVCGGLATVGLLGATAGQAVAAGSSSWFQPLGAAATMTAPAHGAAAAPLPDGDVLIAGGDGGAEEANPLSDAEIYNPAAGTFTATGSLPVPVEGAAAAPLPNGDVLIAGGQNTVGFVNILNSAELYDPTTGTFSNATGSLNTARSSAAAAPLPNGDVLIAGGDTNVNEIPVELATAEIYDPNTETFTPTTGSLSSGVFGAAAAPLPNGDVLIAGGFGKVGGTSEVLATAELYDPTTGMFSTTGSLNTGREYATATPLPDGDVLIAGGENAGGPLSSAEIYNPTTGEFTAAPEALNTARFEAIAAPLPDGQVLISGGQGAGNTVLGSAELYQAAAESAITGGSFGSQTVGDPAGVQTLVVTNLGAQSLTISGVSLSGDTSPFTVTNDACARATLAFRQTCTITVGFTPSDNETYNATLTLADNETTPGTVSLSGTGVLAAVGPQGPAGTDGADGSKGDKGDKGDTGQNGGDGPTGPQGNTGATGPAGPTGPAGAAAAAPKLVLTATKATKSAKQISVRYTLNEAANVTLSVGAPHKRPVAVSTKKARAGLDTITWNRKLKGKKAGKGRYTLTLTAIVGGRTLSKNVNVTL